MYNKIYKFKVVITTLLYSSSIDIVVFETNVFFRGSFQFIILAHLKEYPPKMKNSEDLSRKKATF